MTISLRWLRARLNEADPYEKHPRARVGKARDRLERARASNGDVGFAAERLQGAEGRADAIDRARVECLGYLADMPDVIASLFDADAATLLRKIQDVPQTEDADAEEQGRVILAALLASVDRRIDAQTPAPPTIGDAAIVARAFLGAPSVETLRALADGAHRADAPGAAWNRIGAFLARLPKDRDVEVRVVPYAIEIRWLGARYRFGTGHADDCLGIAD